MAWTVYLARCRDGTLYTGITNDLTRRIAAHDAGRGARYTRGRGPVTVIHSEAAATRGDALRREAAIRRLSPREKRALTVPLARRRSVRAPS